MFWIPQKSILKSGRPRKYLPNFPSQKSPRMENSEPQKILRSSPSLRPVRTTTKNRVWRLPKIGKFVITNVWFLQPCSHLRHAKFFVSARRNFSWSCSRNKMTRRRIAVKEQRINFVAWQKIVGLQIFLKASLKFGDSWVIWKIKTSFALEMASCWQKFLQNKQNFCVQPASPVPPRHVALS